MSTLPFDTSSIRQGPEALDFLLSLIGSSTEYSIIGKDLDGTIVLWNEGARRLYGYAPEDVVGLANSAILHTPEDVQAGLPQLVERVVEEARRLGFEFRARDVHEPFAGVCVADGDGLHGV